MKNEIIDLAKSLIEIKSISPEDKGCFDIVEKYLDQLKFKTERINYLNIENLYSTIGSKGPLFCFLGHMQHVRLALLWFLFINEPARAVGGLGRVGLGVARPGRQQNLDLDLAGALLALERVEFQPL